MRRHGPMVYRVCWRVLEHAARRRGCLPGDVPGSGPETAHAAQACFLGQLAAWGGSPSCPQSQGPSCCPAASRTAKPHGPNALPPDDVTWGELRSALDCELSQLPDKWRLPLILCYLEGRTQEESASQLGWSKSTLRRRLEEARMALGLRLNAAWHRLAGSTVGDSALRFSGLGDAGRGVSRFNG